MGIDFSKIGGQPVEDTPQLTAPAQSSAPAQPAGIDFSHLGAEPVAAPSDQDQQGNEGGIGDTLKMFGREVAGPDTLLGAAGRDIAHGVEGIAHGDVSGALWGNAAPHIQPGSTIEKLIQKLDPNFRGSGTPATAAASEQGSLLNKPLVNVGQEIDVKKNPIAKAIAEASQSFTTPENVAILVGTGGLGMVGSAKTLGIANDLLTSGFGAQTIADAYKHLKSFKDAYDDGDEAQAKYELTHAVLSGALGTVIGRHAAGLETPVVGEGDKALAGKAVSAVTDTVGGAKDAAVSAVKKSLGVPEDFLDAVYKISPPSKGYAQEYINKLKVADPQLRQVMRDKPDVGTPEDIIKAIDNHIKQNDSFVASKAAEVEGKPEAAMTGLQNRVRDDLVQSFKDNPGQYKPEEQDKAIAAVLNHVGQETSKSTAEVKDYRDPTLQEAEGVRKRFDQDTQASFGSNAPAVPAAEAFAKKVAANSLRREIDSKFDSLGIKDVKEFRQQEAALIDVRDQLADAVKKSKDMGTYSKLQSFIKQFGWRIPVAAMAGMFGGGVEGGLAAGLGGAGLGMAADYFRDLRSNPNRMTETASRMANEEAAPNAPQPNEVPPKTGGTPSPVIPGTNFTPPSQLPLVKTETPPNGPANPTKATAGPGLGSKIDLPAYNLPSEPAQNVPADRRAEGTLPADVHKHEWGHVTNAAIENFGTEGIKSDTHPDVGPRTAAAATIVFHGVDFDDPDSVARNSGRILSTILGGAAADELHNGISFEINRMAGGDVKLLKDVFKKVGFTDDEIDSAIRYGLDRAKRNLTQPGIGDILQSNAKVREADLHPDYHASPERTESYAEEVRRIRDANRQTTEKGNETAVQGNDEANARKPGNKSPEVDAGTEGKVPGKDIERNLPATAVIAPEEEETKEPVTARDALENIKSKYGESSNAAKTGEGASFITPEGKFVHLGTDDHPQVIKKAGYESDSQDTRVPFINESGAIRSNFTTGRAGRTLSFSVPKDGVNEEQIDAMKAAVHQGLGRNGQLRIETADSPTNLKNSIKDFATANDVLPMLQEIGAVKETPLDENAIDAIAEQAASDAKKNGGGFTADFRTGKPTDTGYMVEVMPERRVKLDHEFSPTDIRDYYNKNRELFKEHPDLRVGGYKNELNISAHTDDLDAAKKLAKSLDQIAVYDIKKGEDIDTGGKGERKEFANYPFDERMQELRQTGEKGPAGFEHLPKSLHDQLEPDEKRFLSGNKVLQTNVTKAYRNIKPSLAETTNSMNAGAMNAGWWQRFIDTFQAIGGDKKLSKLEPSHAEVLKQWHSALSGNKSVEDAVNLAGHSYLDWLDAGKPTTRKAIDKIIRRNGAQPEESLKKGNAAMSDTLGPHGKILNKGIDTTKIWQLVNSPQMLKGKAFTNEAFGDNPLKGVSPGAVKIPSMGATVAGKGNLNRLVLDAHGLDFYGQNGWTDASYIAHSIHMRQAAEALGLKGGEGQEQQWGVILGLKELLKEGQTPEETAKNITDEFILKKGKDYAEAIKNDPESNALFERLKKYGLKSGTELQTGLDKIIQGRPQARESTNVDTSLLADTARRIRETISPTKIKSKPQAEQNAAGWLSMMQSNKTGQKALGTK